MASNLKTGRSIALLWLGILWCADPALGQPTQAQQSALRSNCRSDFMANCSSVKPGGAEALQCLQRNVAKLSPACRTAVTALNPPPAPQQAAPAAAPTPAPPPAVAASPAPTAAPTAPAPARTTAVPPPAPPQQAARPSAAPPAAAPKQPTPQQQAAIKQSCQSDFMARCRGVPPGGAQALQCLQRNSTQLSPSCRSAVAALGGGHAPAAAPAVTAAPAAAPARPTPQQQAAIKQSCQSDFMARCRGVQPGGAEALQCLQRNSAQLSPNCRSAVAALAGGAPATASTPAAAAAPAAMPTPQQQSAVKFTCRRDFMAYCRGVPQGGPEAFACLQRNAARLSPDCKTSIAAIAEDAPTAAPTAAAAPAAATPVGRPVGPLRRAIRDRMMNQ